MQSLEKQTGQQLFIRGTRKITLTEAGRLLYKRAEEILELYNKTENELKAPVTDVGGDIYIGGGDSKLCFRPLFPKLTSHLYIAWKKYQVFSAASELFLSSLKKMLSAESGAHQPPAQNSLNLI